MGNCLVTKLKGTVDNPNLPVFGEIVLNTFAGGTNTQICIKGVSFEDISVVDNTTEIAPVRTPFDGWLYLRSAGTHVLKVQNKYYITQLYGVGLTNPDDLDFMVNLTSLSLGVRNTLDGGLKSFASLNRLTNLTYLSVITPNDGSFIDNITELLPNHQDTLTALSITENFYITMNMSDLGKFPNLTNCPDISLSPARGAVEEFVAAQRGVGSTEKSMTFDYLGGSGRITWKGVTLENVQSNTLSWTATTITLNGETIQNSDVNP